MYVPEEVDESDEQEDSEDRNFDNNPSKICSSHSFFYSHETYISQRSFHSLILLTMQASSHISLSYYYYYLYIYI